MTTPITEAPALIGTGTQALVENAKRLGLTWQLRPVTVITAVLGSVTGIYDGDTEAIDMIPLTGLPVVGARVMGLAIPPAGNFIIGSLGSSGGTLTNMEYANATADLTLGAADAALVGTLITVDTNGSARWEATGVFDFEETVAGTTLGIGVLYVDGVAQTPLALYRMAATTDRATIPQQWQGVLDAGGSHRFQLFARRSGAAGTQVVHLLHTSLSIKTYE